MTCPALVGGLLAVARSLASQAAARLAPPALACPTLRLACCWHAPRALARLLHMHTHACTRPVTISNTRIVHPKRAYYPSSVDKLFRPCPRPPPGCTLHTHASTPLCMLPPSLPPAGSLRHAAQGVLTGFTNLLLVVLQATARCARRPTSGAAGAPPTATGCTRCSSRSRCGALHHCCAAALLLPCRSLLRLARGAAWLPHRRPFASAPPSACPCAWLHMSARNPHPCAPATTLPWRRACELLRVGGRLVYSTCTFNPVEDEAVVAEVRPLPAQHTLPHRSVGWCRRRQRLAIAWRRALVASHGGAPAVRPCRLQRGHTIPCMQAHPTPPHQPDRCCAAPRAPLS